MPNHKRLLLSLALVAPFAFIAATPTQPKKPVAAKKAVKVFTPGKPAFTPNYDEPAFDPSKVTPDHLEPSAFKVPEGLEITVWATSPQLFNPAPHRLFAGNQRLTVGHQVCNVPSCCIRQR